MELMRDNVFFKLSESSYFISTSKATSTELQSNNWKLFINQQTFREAWEYLFSHGGC